MGTKEIVMKKLFISAIIIVALATAGVVLLPEEAQCWGNNCPPYNSPCLTNYSCGFRCGMSCVKVDQYGFQKRCR